MLARICREDGRPSRSRALAILSSIGTSPFLAGGGRVGARADRGHYGDKSDDLQREAARDISAACPHPVGP